mmetsp:Transcript_26622/g.83302  ORF Transcript_26622/g.83302 Transcript_26622/m.83302 type:complete len:348 (-) Transcript_26622:187-1230(-)
MRPHEVSMSKICDGESALTGAPVSSLQHVGSSVRRRAAEIKIGGATTPYTHPHPNCPRKRGGAPAPLTRDRSSAAPREAARSASLLPPRGLAGAEVGLRPRGEDDLAILVLDVGEGEGERGRAAHDLALLVVLGAVARAHELALGGVPGHDAAEVGAHGGEAVVLERLVVVHDEVGGVTLEALHELASARVVGAQPATLRHVVTEGVLGDRTGAAAAAAGRHEKGDVRHGHAEAGNAHGRREDGVHHVTAVHVRHEGICLGLGLGVASELLSSSSSWSWERRAPKTRFDFRASATRWSWFLPRPGAFDAPGVVRTTQWHTRRHALALSLALAPRGARRERARPGGHW